MATEGVSRLFGSFEPEPFHQQFEDMDSQLQRDGRILMLVDKSWKDDIRSLPYEEIPVPLMELPDPEPDNGNPLETLKEQEQKWTDLGLSRVTETQSGATH